MTRKHDSEWGANTDAHLESVEQHFLEREAVLDVMREIVALFQKRYVGSLDVLAQMARGASWEEALANQGGSTGNVARVLKNFGVINGHGAMPQTIAWYLKHEYSIVPDIRRVG